MAGVRHQHAVATKGLVTMHKNFIIYNDEFVHIKQVNYLGRTVLFGNSNAWAVSCNIKCAPDI